MRRAGTSGEETLLVPDCNPSINHGRQVAQQASPHATFPPSSLSGGLCVGVGRPALEPHLHICRHGVYHPIEIEVTRPAEKPNQIPIATPS